MIIRRIYAFNLVPLLAGGLSFAPFAFVALFAGVWGDPKGVVITAMASGVVTAIVVGLAARFFVSRMVGRVREIDGKCAWCGYDLECIAVEKCPECGMHMHSERTT